jgi:hypothetical protein
MSRPFDLVDHAAQTNAEERERIATQGGILRQHIGGGSGGSGEWRVGETGLAAGRRSSTLNLTN